MQKFTNNAILQGGVFIVTPPLFSTIIKKNLLNQQGAFYIEKFLKFLKSTSAWLQLVFHFGSENRVERLKRPW